MVSGSSVGPVHLDFQQHPASTTTPYDDFASAAGPTSPHPRARPTAPPSPPRSASAYGLPALAPAPYDRAVSPSPSNGSAPGLTSPSPHPPGMERMGLGRFSASTPQFHASALSPRDRFAAESDGGAAQYSQQPTPQSPFENIRPEQLALAVGPEASLALREELGAAAAAASSEAATAARSPAPSGRVAEAAGLMPPPPPQSAQPAGLVSPGQGDQSLRGRLPGGPSGNGMADAPGLGPAVISPAGSLADHLSRTASLPLIMGSAVVGQGSTAAIPIAIAGVGTSGRARATTVHTPPAAAAAAGGPGTSHFRDTRSVTQAVDHHFSNHQTSAAGATTPPPAPQPNHVHHSEGGVACSSPAQFVGSASPPRSSGFLAALAAAGAPPVLGASSVPVGTGMAALLAARSPQKPAGTPGLETGSVSTPGGVAPMSCRGPGLMESGPSGRSGPRRGCDRLDEEGPEDVPQLQAVPSRGPSTNGFAGFQYPPFSPGPAQIPSVLHPSFDLAQAQQPQHAPPAPQDAQRAQQGPEPQPHATPQHQRVGAFRQAAADEDSVMEPGSLASSQGIHSALVTAREQARQGSTDGDEEFVDAVEVQHDDDDHVHEFGPGAGPLTSAASRGGGAAANGAAAAAETSSGGHGLASPSHPTAHPYYHHTTHPSAPHHGHSPHHAAAQPAGPHHAEDFGGVPLRGSAVVYVDEGEDEVLEEEAADEDDYGDRAIADVATHDSRLLEDEVEPAYDEDEADEDEDDLDDGPPYGAAGWGAPTAGVTAAAGGTTTGGPYVSNYVMEHHYCVNCTRPFWGSVCRYCNQAADVEVVSPELLAAAVQKVAAGTATAPTGRTSQDGAGAELQRRGGVLLSYDDRCRQHLEETSPGCAADKGRSHPERPERVAAIMARLQGSGVLDRCACFSGREATAEELKAVHDPELLRELEEAAEGAKRAAARAAALEAGASAGQADAEAGDGDTDMGVDLFTRRSHILDCYFNASTNACARIAAGSAAEVAMRVYRGASQHGAAIIRPPGHHAESSVAMGFCYYNNAAVAARAAQAAGARRVIIMDWDVHHGNGTQRIFYDDPTVLYMSTHRYDRGTYYPGTGGADEVGTGAGTGFTVNVPWNVSGIRDADMVAAFRHVILPIAAEFQPDLLIVSAGFDAVDGDPLGGCRVSPAAYGHFTRFLCGVAPSVLLLEGGYNLTATAAATEACMRVLLGEAPEPLPASGAAAGAAADGADGAQVPGFEGVSDSAIESIQTALRIQSAYWHCARDHAAVVDAAVEERRRQQQLARLQAVPPQPQEAWGWHVQAAAVPPTPPSAPVPAMFGPAGVIDAGPSPQPQPTPSALMPGDPLLHHAHANGLALHELAGGMPEHRPVSVHEHDQEHGHGHEEDEEERVRPRRMDVSMCGVGLFSGDEEEDSDGEEMADGDTHMG
ncbi:hypothetical protein HYH03_004232 [Edaphochlamys debaryana]|uniref:Histone deacetylase domain-containing protein n=1 Tax=Edaphochlamys debaryana TaxID=47281 RepID=A0A835Y8H2_9CHLO|nr:hypothetical protein HYH03_004232 [Edaphochlamys debaryana]|eukprot:KAG2497971.1 hypothetical protein HYH03_004232 [Edaphochlamys debaryana]